MCALPVRARFSAPIHGLSRIAMRACIAPRCTAISVASSSSSPNSPGSGLPCRARRWSRNRSRSSRAAPVSATSITRFDPRRRQACQPPRESAVEEIFCAEFSRDVLEGMPRAVVARSALAEEEQRIERLELFLELADPLESVFVGGGFPDCHDRLLRG